jgi:endo-alpha-1,4-polygalactosaminidase (GH114 family)
MRRGAFLPVLLLITASLNAAGPKIACYYGSGRVDELARYDVVILQPDNYTPADVARLKKGGVSKVLGYVSLGEDDSLRRGNGKGPGGYASWYVDEFTGKGFGSIGADGAPDRNAEWDAYYVDPSDRRWRANIRDQVERLRGLGFDGVFADTALVPRDVYREKTERRMVSGMVRLVRSLKGWVDGGLVYVNNGYDDLENWQDRIDGVMIESTVEKTTDYWDEVRREAELVREAGGRRKLDALGLLYVSKAADIAPACAALSEIGLPSAVYVSDADGLALRTTPDATCP